MARTQFLNFVVGVVGVIFAATSALAANCKNGETLYKKTTPSVSFSCSDSLCHGPKVDQKSIQTAAGNWSAIDLALDGVEGNAEMVALDLRNQLPLTQSDLEDLADYIFYAGAKQACPAASPAAVSASPTSLSFGNINVGSSSASQTVTVTNTGGTTSGNVTFPAAPAGFSKAGGCTNGPLTPGASCTLMFTFSPTAAGVVSSTYTIGGSVSIPISLSGTGVSVSTTPNVNATPTSLTFGSINVGSTSAAQTVTVTNSGTAAATNMSYPAAPTGYTKGGTCSSATLAAGANCTITFAFSPSAAGASSQTYTFTGGGKSIAVSLSGTGTSSSSAAALSVTPSALAFGDVVIANTAAAQNVTLRNTGGTAASGVTMTNSNGAEFIVSGNTCGTSLGAGATCTLSVAYRPAAAGADSASITFSATGVTAATVSLSGNGVTSAPPAGTPVVAYEFYHAGFGHYFVTSIADEVTKLNNGTFVGWTSTGKSFKVYSGSATGLVPVCRFFSTAFGERSSHFYTPDAPECTIVKSGVTWQFEGEVFYTVKPAADGSCAAGTVPVYRLYNNGKDGAPNHRYTSDFTVREQMRIAGWIPEGYGIGVIMCAPQ